MRVLVALQFEEGDAMGEVELNFADGSSVVLSHEKGQAQVSLDAFDAQAPAAPAAPPAPSKEGSEDD